MVSTINELKEKQNEESNIKLLAAQRTLYNKARFYQVIIFFIPILLPVILSIVKLYYNNNIIDFLLNVLNICNIAVYMLIYNKIDELKEYAAIIQQQFDKNVYGIDIDININRLELVSIVEKNYKNIFNNKNKKQRLYDWYIFNENCNIKEHDIILFCQQTNVFWSEKLKEKYINILSYLTYILIIIIVIIIYITASTEHNCTKIIFQNVLPLSEIFIFSYINYSNIKKELKLLKHINTNINNLLEKNKQDTDKSNHILKIQNDIFEYRKKSILIFNVFYNFFKTDFENTIKSYK